MTTSATISTYARVLFDLANAVDAVDAADEGLRAIVETVRGNVELRDVLSDDAVDTTKKREILREIFSGAASPEAVAVAGLVIERGQIDSLTRILEEFSEKAEAERGIVVAEVTTAVPLTDQLRTLLAEKLAASLGRPVTLRERVDASIIGGVRINVAGKVLDGSLSSQLDGLRMTLESASQGGEA